MAKQYTAEERSRNAQKQLRDRLGKFIPMGGTASYVSKGKKKTATVLGNDGTYVYFLPPIKNINHRPEPYRVPISAVNLTGIDKKASLKKKEEREAEKKAIDEATKDFLDRITPNQRKNIERVQEVTEQMEREKKDVDYFEEKEGVVSLGKNERKEADEATTKVVEQLLRDTDEGKPNEFPLPDGMRATFERSGDRYRVSIVDRDGDEIQSDLYSTERGEQGLAQQAASEIQTFLDAYDTTEEVIVDIDEDGIPDDKDPSINVEVSTPDPTARRYDRTELDTSVKDTKLTEGTGNSVLYVKTALREEERGYRWQRYEKTPSGQYENKGHVYAEDLANADLKVATTSPRKKRSRTLPDNSNKYGVRGMGKELANQLPAYEAELVGTRQFVRLGEKPEVDKLPIGTTIRHQTANGKSADMVKISKDMWFGKAGEFTNEEFLEAMEDRPLVKPATSSTLTKDGDTKLSAYRKKNGLDENPVEAVTKKLSEVIDYAAETKRLKLEGVRSDSDMDGTRYDILGKNGVIDESYIKKGDSYINTEDSSLEFTAEEFDEFYIDKNGLPLYDKNLPDEYRNETPDFDFDAIEVKTDFEDTKPIGRVGSPLNETQSRILSLKGGSDYTLSDDFEARAKELARLNKAGLVDVKDFDPTLLYQSPSGTPAKDAFHYNGEPMRVGDRVFIPKGKREDGNPDTPYHDLEDAYVEHVIVGFSNGGGQNSGKHDVLAFPLEEVDLRIRRSNGSTKEQLYGPEFILSNTSAYRSANYDRVLLPDDDGNLQSGSRAIENTAGRVGSHSLGQFYGADGKELFKGDDITFRHRDIQEPVLDENGGVVWDEEGNIITAGPYSAVINGTILDFNEKNQSLTVQFVDDDGNTVIRQPSIKYSVKGNNSEVPTPEDYRTKENLPELPEGFSRDVEGRVIDGYGQRISESRTAPPETGEQGAKTYEPVGDSYLEDIFGEGDTSPSPEEIFGEEDTLSDVERLSAAINNNSNHVDGVNEYLGRKGEISVVSQEEYDSLDTDERYRGVSQEGVEAFYRSELGKGGPGPALYVSDSRSEAEGYAGSTGETIPVKFREDAKFVTADQLAEDLKGLDDSDVSNFIRTAEGTVQAAYFGYDVIDLSSDGSDFRSGNYAVVNPSVIVTPERESNKGETSVPTPQEQTAKRKRNLINSIVATQQEYSSEIPRYFRDLKDKDYSSDKDKAKDWASAPVGSAIRVKGGTFAIKTGDKTWDFRRSSKHLVQRNLSTSQMAKILEDSPEILENGRTTAPSRKKFLEYNGGKVQATKAPSSEKAPTGSQIEVEGESVTKTSNGWETEQGELLSDNQVNTLLSDHPEDVKISKVSVAKVSGEGKRKVAAQDSLFDMGDDGTVTFTPGIYTDEKSTKISAEDADTLFANLTDSFDVTTVDKSSDGPELITLDSEGTISAEVDSDSSSVAETATTRFAQEFNYEPPARIVSDNSDYFQTAKALTKPNPDGGYDLIINSDGASEAEVAQAVAEGLRTRVASANGVSPREMDQRVVGKVYSARVEDPDANISKSYDEILKELGIRSKRKGSIVVEAFKDVWENGADAKPVHLDIWSEYASDAEALSLFRKENGRDPRSDEELRKFRKGL